MAEPNRRGSKSAVLSRLCMILVMSVAWLCGCNRYGLNRSVRKFQAQFVLFQTVTNHSNNKMEIPLRDVDGLSLVTSFWAEKHGMHQHGHRRESEAAMLVNLQNPHLRQVVVILDSVNENTTDCAAFVSHMTLALANITRSLPLFTEASTNPPALPELLCIEHRGQFSGQPTYFDMFHYATYHPSITSDKVVLSNADQVFDETLAHSKNMSKNTIFVLSTHGYNPNSVPQNIREQYLALVGPEHGKAKTDSLCHGRLRERSMSWDTYIFHRSLLADSLKGTENFTRLNFWRVPTVYYMNEDGAENAALYDITRGLVGKVTVWNACHLIRIWHFHLLTKTHHENTRWPRMTDYRGGFIFYEDYGPKAPRDGRSFESSATIPNIPTTRVPIPHFFVPFCVNDATCFSEKPLNETLYQSGVQRGDASLVRAMLNNTTPTFEH